MALIAAVLSLVIMEILYTRMIRRKVPDSIPRAQALLPVIMGVFSLFISFGFFLGLALVLYNAGFETAGMSPYIRSLVSAFFLAGLPEEAAKLLMILASIRLLRKMIRNVYEYILIGAGAGLGFTVFEEFIYGQGGAVMLARLVLVTLHMIFGMIMAGHLGMARYKKETGGNVIPDYVKAILVPMAMHTLYDACTATNQLLDVGNEDLETIGVFLGITAVSVMFFIQVASFVRMKAFAAKYCSMTFDQAPL